MFCGWASQNAGHSPLPSTIFIRAENTPYFWVNVPTVSIRPLTHLAPDFLALIVRRPFPTETWEVDQIVSPNPGQ